MTVADLDRLVTKTAMTPVSKRALRDVRKAVIAGIVGEAEISRASWSIAVDTVQGVPMTMTFSFRRD